MNKIKYHVYLHTLKEKHIFLTYLAFQTTRKWGKLKAWKMDSAVEIKGTNK